MGAKTFLVWALTAGSRVRARLTSRRVNKRGRHPMPWAAPHQLRPGIVIAGFLQNEIGVGEAGRAVLAGVEASGMEHTAVNIDYGNRPDYPTKECCGPYDFDTTILVGTAHQVEDLQGYLGQRFFAGRKNIALWSWELEEFPFLDAASRFDEIWANSEFAACSLCGDVSVPVRTFPLPVRHPDKTSSDLEMLRLPHRPLFLFMFDYRSVLERKNPLGVIEAFSAAFTPGEGPILVLKSLNGVGKPEDHERVRSAASKRQDIILIEQYLERRVLDALLNRADCFVSLHRSEGFGFGIAEAMALAKPVIATGYSGNLDYMTEHNSFLVPYRLTDVPPGCDPYPVGARWAAPDLAEASRLMRLILEQPDLSHERGQRAAREITRTHGVEVAARFLREHIEGNARLGDR